MSNIITGDKVIAYSGELKHVGYVELIHGHDNEFLDVAVGNVSETMTFYRKQCRRLIPKKKKRIIEGWMSPKAFTSDGAFSFCRKKLDCAFAHVRVTEL